jgi:DNA-binding PadR family transcriptional regulator
MHRDATITGGGRSGGCRHGGGEAFDFALLWRAMTGVRGGGRGGHAHRHGRGGYGDWGMGPGGGFPFGGGRGGFGPRGPKARRGDVRTAALLLLAEEPRNGYQIMQALQERSGGMWRPSPGAVYPALQQLEDEGLIRSQERDGRKLYELTDEGRHYVEERGDEPAPWEEMTGGVSDDAWSLMHTAREVGMAMLQVLQTGSEAQRAEAQRILVAARRDLYRLLADGDPQTGGAGAPGDEPRDDGDDDATGSGRQSPTT